MLKTRIPPESFFLNREAQQSFQMQIRETVISLIQSGQAMAGSHLPSSRKLAEYLGVARMTVTLAYSELVSQGYLETRDRSGFVIAHTENGDASLSRQSPDISENTLNWQDRIGSALSTRRRVIKPAHWRALPYPFAYGQMDSTLFSHDAWRDCARQAMGKRDFMDMAGDLVVADDPILVNYIKTRSLPRRGIAAETDEILVTVGAQHGLWLAIELLTRTPLKAVCENPGYPDTRQALTWRGADLTVLDVDESGLPPEHIPDGTEAVFITPSHHAPTGATMPLSRKQTLLEKADQKDFVIIEDDYEFEMSFLAPPTPAIKSYDRSGRVIYVGSFSKAMFPGLRLGYLVGPKDFISEARELRSMMLRHPPGHQQRTVAYFLAQGHYDLLIRKMRKTFAERRHAMLEALAKTDLHIAGAAHFGGSSLWIKGPEGIDTSILAQELLQDGVVIEAGAPFFKETESAGDTVPAHYFRLGYSSIPTERIPKGIALIAERISRYHHP